MRKRITSTICRDFRVPADNRTVYLAIGRGSHERALRSPLPFLWLPDSVDPLDYQYPVRGCGVIIYDGGRISEARYARLLCVLHEDGAEAVIYYSHKDGVASKAWSHDRIS